jgi:hypothetical protein
MQRQPRDNSWDNFSLDDYITEDVEPVNILTNEKELIVPDSASSIYETFKNWITDCLYLTQEAGTEHGFQLDGYGNVYGLYGGLEGRINFPDDHPQNVVLNVHTHPVNDSNKYSNEFLIPLFSKPDIESSIPLKTQDEMVSGQEDVGSTSIAVTNASANPPEVKHAIVTLSKSDNPPQTLTPTYDRFTFVGQSIKNELGEDTNLNEIMTDSALFDMDVKGHIQEVVQILDNMSSDFQLTYNIVEDNSIISEENIQQ